MIASYQVFPVTSQTYSGTATAKPLFGERLVRVMGSCDVTFHQTGADLTVTITEASDFVCSADCTAITASDSVEVLMS